MKSYAILLAVFIMIALSGCDKRTSKSIDPTVTASDSSSTTTLVLPTPTWDPSNGPSYKEIRAGLVRLWREAQKIPTPIYPDTPGAGTEEISQQFEKLISNLKSKEVRLWQGWVVQVREAKEGGPYWVTLDMDEFHDRNPFLGF